MTTEDIVSIKVARLLKKKGFDYECTHCFNLYTNKLQNIHDDVIGNVHPEDWNHITEEELCDIGLSRWTNLSAPVLSTALKWLRKVHNLHIWVWHATGKGVSWFYEIHSFSNEEVKHIGSIQGVSYEAACEEALKYCLKNLIK